MEEQEKDTKEEAKAEDKNNVHFAGFQVEDGTKMKACKYCRVMVPKSAWICPNCKMKIRRHWGRLLAGILFVALLAGGTAYLILTENGNALMVSAGLTSKAGNAGTETATVAEPQEDKTAQTGNAQTGEKTETDTAVDGTTEAQTQQALGDVSKLASAIKLETAKADSKEKDQTSAQQDAAAGEDMIEEAFAITPADGEETGASDQSDKAETETQKSAETNAEGETAESDGESADAVQDVDPAAYSEADFKALCETIDYRSLMRGAQEYDGQCLKVEAEILEQIDGGLFDDNSYYLAAAKDAKGITRYYILRDDRGEDALPLFEGDTVLVYGQMFATCVPKSSELAADREVPAVTMVYLDLLEN